MDAMTITNSNVLTNIMASQNGGFVLALTAIVALYAIHEISEKIELGMEKEYDMSLSSEKFGQISFTKQSTIA